jgi:hypothetical protein
MKPTYRTIRPARFGDSARAFGHSINKAPVTDWSFQSGADLRAGVSTSASDALAPRRGLYAVTQGLYEAETKWEDRIEGIGLCVVIALASLPIIEAIYIAIRTV